MFLKYIIGTLSAIKLDGLRSFCRGTKYSGITIRYIKVKVSRYRSGVAQRWVEV